MAGDGSYDIFYDIFQNLSFDLLNSRRFPYRDLKFKYEHVYLT